MNRLLTGVVVLPIRVYQRFISPVLPPACRFYPTCSAYAAEAILRHGVLRGGLLALRRLARCHPFGDFGCDPVPPAQDRRAVEHLSEE
ncbi:MAG: membrane protein insertion efficiency factor YidD [Desulfovibrio sp.]|jgi:putative membrane protein insertion efficiency factor|nr:membrane protein insertion efficiency factor YidD [Desulfovibrio sp.]